MNNERRKIVEFFRLNLHERRKNVARPEDILDSRRLNSQFKELHSKFLTSAIICFFSLFENFYICEKVKKFAALVRSPKESDSLEDDDIYNVFESSYQLA